MPRLLADVVRLLDAAHPVHAVLDEDGEVVRVSERARTWLGLRTGTGWRRTLTVVGASLVSGASPETFAGRPLRLYARARPEQRLRGQIVPAGHRLWALIVTPVVTERSALGELEGSLADHDPTPELLVSLEAIEQDRRALQRTLRALRRRQLTLERELEQARARIATLERVGSPMAPTEGSASGARTRLELLGQLAGSITHDLNNLLVVILGHATHGLEEGTPRASQQALEGVLDAAQRAAALTARVLTLGRPASTDERPVDAAREVRQIAGLLRRLLQERVELTVDVHAQPAWIPLDASRLEQVLVNLAINARDAMPDGGRLRVVVDRRTVDEGLAGSLGLAHGPCVCLIVQDSGQGMPPEVRDRVFEPFFTTKGPGQGTGLGLATVAEVIREAGGAVQVSSQPGRGTTFSIWLPLAEAPRGALPTRANLGRAPASEGRTILLVDDESQIRRVVGRMLRKGGWEVVEAGSPKDALERLPPLGDLALVITDQQMPGGTGVELVEAVHARRADLPCIVMSGYSDDVELREGARAGHFRLLPKPFDASRLLEAVNRTVTRSRLEQLGETLTEPPTMPSWIGRAS